MKRAWIDCLAAPTSGAPLELDPMRVADDEIVEGFLVSTDTREVWPIVAGVGVLSRDLRAHLRAQGNVYRRSPINDPRLARFLLGEAGTGYVVVPFEEVVGHYRDLAAEPPEGYDTSPHPLDVTLRAELSAQAVPSDGRALVIGAGVGRAVFILCEHLAAAVGIDSSIACVRRARNIAVTNEAFFLPAPKGSGMKEIPLDLGSLSRDGADFAVADATALPFADDAFDVVVLHSGDRDGPWADADAVATEAQRVLAPTGRQILLEGPATA